MVKYKIDEGGGKGPKIVIWEITGEWGEGVQKSYTRTDPPNLTYPGSVLVYDFWTPPHPRLSILYMALFFCYLGLG